MPRPNRLRVRPVSAALLLAALVTALAPPTARAADAAAALLDIKVAGFQTSRIVHPGDPLVPVYLLAVANTSLFANTIQSITFENRSNASGGTAGKDASWQPLTLSTSGNAGVVLNPGTRTVHATASFSNGLLRFTGLSIPVPALDSVYVLISGGASLLARDGDNLDLRIPSEASIVVANSSVDATGALDPPGNFPVDGMTAAQITVDSVATAYFPIGATGQLALSVRIPPNGYDDDKLKGVQVVNKGNASGSDIARMDVWMDDGDGVYEPGQEARLGTLVFTGSNWALGGLDEDLRAPGGMRLFFTVDISDDAAEGAVVWLGIPVNGITVASANDGPNDKPVYQPSPQVISLIDRIVVAPVALASGFAPPGKAGLPVFAMRISSAYVTTRTLTALTLTNTTIGPGALHELDAEFDRLELRLDADHDGAPAFADPVVGTAVFSNRRAQFSGLSIALDPFREHTLFVTGDASLLRAADGDVLATALDARADVEFAPPSAIAGDFPVSSGNGWTVDGMIAAQVGNAGAPPATLAPNDGPVAALDVKVPPNGYQNDVLEGVQIVNLGTAQAADLAELRLWRDGGDGRFDGGGDDVDLGPLTFGVDSWTSAPLAVPLGSEGARLFVSATAAAAPTDSATVRLAIPRDGLTVTSGNDGPMDAAIENPDALLLANRGLLASLSFGPGTVTVGQNVTLRMAVRSTAPESLIAITPGALGWSGTAALAMLTGPLPATLDLAPGGVSEFTWTFRADSAGTARVTANASGTGSPSGQPAVSLDALSNEVRVFARADSLPLTITQAMPQSVTRGQTGVLPLYLTFVHPDPEGSPVRVSGLRVRLEREDGSDVVPASLLARAVVLAASETLLVRSSLETTGAVLDLTLATPAIVSGSSPLTLAVGLDISATTVVPDFRIVVPDETEVYAEDAATGAPVEVRLQGATWPFWTGLARVLAGATQLDVSADALPPVRAGRGQNDVTLATFTLGNPGITGVTTDVRVGALDIKLADTLGVRIAKPGRIVRRLKLRSGTQTFADRPVAPGLDSVVTLTLSPLLAVPVNTPIEMRLVADVSDTASLGPFHLEIGDSARFDARDPNTGARVPILYAQHPPRGPRVTIEARADSVFARGVPHLPSELGVGARGVHALSIVLRHPGPPAAARLRVDTLVVRCLDESGAPLVPAAYLDRMQVLWNGTLAASVPDPPPSGSSMTAVLPGPTLEPGDTARITIVLDFESTAPATSFAVAVSASGLDADDANLGSDAVPVVEGGGEFPLLSGITRLVAPSRLLTVDLADAMPAVLAPDGLDVTAGTLRLANGAAPGSGPVRVAYLIVEARGAAGPVALGAAFGRAAVAIGGVPFGTSAPLTPDSVTAVIPFPSELLVTPEAPVDLELRVATRTDPSVSTVALVIDAPDIGVVQPGNPLLDVSILPAPGRAFPLVTASATYGAAGLEASWSSFPNPFSPARGGATFTYYLSTPGRVTLEIWTPRGERVVTLLDSAPRGAGLHQSDVWDGRNGVGALVQHGVYVADLVVQLDDGTSGHLRRKVAVVR